MYQETVQQSQATVADMSSTGDKIVLTPAFPIEVYEFGFIVTTVIAGTPPVIAMDSRPTAGSDTGRNEGDAGTLTTVAGDIAGMVPGVKVVSRPVKPLTILPGQQVVFEIVTGATSGAAIAFINWRNKPTYRDAVDIVKTA